MRDALAKIEAEATWASGRYGAFTSTHEGLGVLIEEIDELRDAVRSNVIGAVEREAVQVAAVALRLAAECICARECEYSTPFSKRSIP